MAVQLKPSLSTQLLALRYYYYHNPPAPSAHRGSAIWGPGSLSQPPQPTLQARGQLSKWLTGGLMFSYNPSFFLRCVCSFPAPTPKHEDRRRSENECSQLVIQAPVKLIGTSESSNRWVKVISRHRTVHNSNVYHTRERERA